MPEGPAKLVLECRSRGSRLTISLLSIVNSHLTKLTILTKLTNEPSQPSSIQYRESSYLRAYKALHLSRILYKSATFYAKQTQFPKKSNERKHL